MQTITTTELAQWHEYEVGSRREIAALLRQIVEKRSLVRVQLPGPDDGFVTTLLRVDPDAGTMVLDHCIDTSQRQRLLAAGSVFCETSLDKIRIIFSAEAPRPLAFEGGQALEAELPASLFRLQRRADYRMPTPLSNPVRALVPLPARLGGGAGTFPLADISCGGIALFDNKLQLDDPIGHIFTGCNIELPAFGTVTTGLQVRNVVDMTLLNNKSNRRLGCQFVDMPRAASALVQRYILKLERERNMRLAGH